MIGTIVFSVTAFCYILLSFSRNLSISYKIGNVISKGVLGLLIVDYLAENLLSLHWFGTPLIYILLYLECLLFYGLSIKNTSRKDQLAFLPLINFSFLILTCENVSNDNISVFLIGSFVLSFLNFRRSSQKASHWSWFLPILLGSFLAIFFQFNNNLEWNIGLPLLFYFLLGKRLPMAIEEERTNPFSYPLVSRIVLIGILNCNLPLIGNGEVWLTGYVLLALLFIAKVFYVRSECLRWPLFNKGLEFLYLGALILFGYETKTGDMLFLFITLSLTSFVGLCSVKKHKKPYILFKSLVLLFMSGMIVGPAQSFFKNLWPQIVYFGEENSSMLVFILIVSFNCIYFYSLATKKRTFIPNKAM